MFKVYKNVEMTKEGYLFGIEAAEASRQCAPGQYFELAMPGDEHRIPVVLTDILPDRGIIKVVFRPINDTTRAMAVMEDGGEVEGVFGPYGRKAPFLDEEWEGKQVLVIAEDLAGAQAYMIIHDLKKKGAAVDAVAGGRTKGCLYLSEFTGELCRDYLNLSEDGTQGETGTICGKIDDILAKTDYNMCVVMGSVEIWQVVAKKTAMKNIPTWISVDSMVTSKDGYRFLDHVMVKGERVEIREQGTMMKADGVDFEELKGQL